MPAIEALVSQAEEHRSKTGRPLVTLSYAQSFDGSLAAHRGKPLALSGPLSLELTHRLRAAHEAILVGIGTLLSDNPQLTVRLVEGRQPQPLVLDSRLRTPPEARLFSGPCKPWIAALNPLPSDRQAALEQAGARLLPFDPGPDGRIPLPALLERLAGQGVNSLMVEGGAEVLVAFLAQRLADQAVITIAPIFVGGLHALSQETPLYPFLRLKDFNFEQLGEDLVIWGKVV
jgi:3,4-dihydroxy 2-butanone 4-phosphate synthase/GTP cyclohydrolase II